MTLEEEIMKLDLIASDAFEGGDVNEFRQLAEWLRELKAYREQLPHEITEYKKLQAERLEKEVNRTNCNYYLVEYFKGYISGFSFVEGIIAKIIEEVNADESMGE